MMPNLTPHDDSRAEVPARTSQLAWLADKTNRWLQIGRGLDGTRVRKCEYISILKESQKGLT